MEKIIFKDKSIQRIDQRTSFLILIICCLFTIIACNKEKAIPSQTLTEVQPLIGNYKTTPLDAVTVKNGTMYIDDFYSLYYLLNYLDSISKNDRYAFENSFAFTSLTTIYDSLFLIVENLNTVSEVKSFTNNNPEYFTLLSDELRMNFPYDYYHTIANNNGIFVIDQTVCRITQKGIIAWEGGSISQISQLVIDDSFNINLHQYLYFIATMVQSRSGCNSNQEVTCTNDDNNRRITFSIYTFKPGGNAWGSCQGNPKIYYHYNLTIDVIGEIKRIWGWNRYETELEYKEVYCEINVPFQYHFDPNLCISLWDFTTGGVTNESKNVEGRILTKSWIGGIDNQVMGNELCNITNLQAPYFNKVKGKATSRGLAGKWAIIDCGY